MNLINGQKVILSAGDTAIVSKEGEHACALFFKRDDQLVYWRTGETKRLFNTRADCLKAFETALDATGLRSEMLEIKGPVSTIDGSEISDAARDLLTQTAQRITYHLIPG